MLTTLLHLSRQAKALAAATVACCALLAPMKSYAQTDQMAVLFCRYEPQGSDAGAGDLLLTLDLTKQTYLIKSAGPLQGVGVPYNGGSLTEVTDGQIKWGPQEVDDTFESGALNRYSGQLEVTALRADNNHKYDMHISFVCQKQQKQF